MGDGTPDNEGLLNEEAYKNERVQVTSTSLISSRKSMTN